MDSGADSYRRFLNGDEDGIVEIIRDYKDGLMLYLNKYVQNIHVAEELTEDTFVKVVVKRPRFSGKSSFKTWLYAIGRNVAVDHLRRISRITIVPLDNVPISDGDERDIELCYITNERKILIHRMLERINPEYRKVIYLAYFEDFKNEQIAYIMKKSKKQTENLIYRAKTALRSELMKEGFVYEEL